MPLVLLKISRVTAFALLILSLFLPWFRVPTGLRADLAGEKFAVILREPVSTIGFKVFLLVVLVTLCWLARTQKRSGAAGWVSPMDIGGRVLLIALSIGYPALTMQRCAAISAHAEWLQAQNHSLIETNGDSFSGQEYFYQSQQPAVEVKEILPRSFLAVPAPFISSISDLRLFRLGEIVEWLGLSHGFCEFVRVGWFCGIFGSFLLVVSFMQTGQGTIAASGPSGGWGGNILAFTVCGIFLFCALCLGPVVMAGRDLAKAQDAAIVGNFGQSLKHLDAAQVWVPALAYNTDLICQRGWLEQKLGINSPSAQVLSAFHEEAEGFHFRAAQTYADLLDREIPSPVRDEAFRGALRLALRDFNSGLIDRASSRLDELIQIDPTCVKAYYALQLADLRGLQKDRLERDAAKFEALYNCFASLEKSVVIASAHRRVAELEFDYRDVGRLGDEMRAAVKPLP
jgi:hypothetical protein